MVCMKAVELPGSLSLIEALRLRALDDGTYYTLRSTVLAGVSMTYAPAVNVLPMLQLEFHC